MSRDTMAYGQRNQENERNKEMPSPGKEKSSRQAPQPREKQGWNHNQEVDEETPRAPRSSRKY